MGIDNFSHKTDRGERKHFPIRFDKYKSNNHSFYEMDYQKYFAEIHDGTIGFYIYDGLHRYKNQLEALQVAEPYFGENCIIFIDDTNGTEPRGATLDFIAQSENKYRILLNRQTAGKMHPTLWEGVIVFQKVG
ncbi:MAG: class I SAM-dependent methyltransferase [Candidatus Marinimicrobia bacterium]|nr:class I SAM-dependent methyltransferase [Candidatus Neomarinimicrobiota bacterium]